MTVNIPAMAAGATGPTAAGAGAAGAVAWLRTRRGQVFVGVPVAVALAVVIGVLALAPGGGSSPGKLTPTGRPTAAGSRAASAVRTGATPTPTPQPPIGDACLVGTWQSHGNQTTTQYDGSTVTVTGGSGNVDHITAAGTDTDVYGPDTLPFYGTYEGSSLKQDTLGEDILSVHANPRTHVVTLVDRGWTEGSTNNYVYQGSNVSGIFTKPSSTPYKQGYKCTATTLTYTSAGKVVEVETRTSAVP
jgi:hypothetical protein